MSFSTVLSAAIEGLKVEFVRVEADVSNGLPVFHMVGYLSSEVREAGERVRTAIKNSGFDYPAKRTVINLSPATHSEKEGRHLICRLLYQYCLHWDRFCREKWKNI